MGLYINCSFHSTLTSLPTTLMNEYEGAVEAACRYYEHVSTSPNEITVNILFSWGTEDGNAIAGNTVGQKNAILVDESYTALKNALSNRAFALALSGTDPGDSIIAANTLPSSNLAPGGDGSYFGSNARAKALGLTIRGAKQGMQCPA
jgi:hypothetical protein